MGIRILWTTCRLEISNFEVFFIIIIIMAIVFLHRFQLFIRLEICFRASFYIWSEMIVK